jgi:hypothetical protein
MFYKRISIIVTIVIIFLLSAISVAQAAPPLQEGDSSDGSTLGETLDLDGVDDTDGKHNLGTIMSEKDSTDEADEDVPEGDTPEDDTSEGDTSEGDTSEGDTSEGDTSEGDTADDSLKEHPVASALAEYFDVTYDEIMDLHEAGNGFGTITKAYFFAEKLDMEPGELLEAAHGSGWGNVLKEGGIHPGSVGNGGSNRPENAGPPDKDGPPGQNKKNTDVSEFAGQGGGNGNGNKGGNGHGNGNKDGNGVSGQLNGNGQGHGNGGGNGNGNGRGNGNGNGGGKGRGGK